MRPVSVARPASPPPEYDDLFFGVETVPIPVSRGHSLSKLSVLPSASQHDLRIQSQARASMSTPPPEHSLSPEEQLQRLLQQMLPHSTSNQPPRHQGGSCATVCAMDARVTTPRSTYCDTTKSKHCGCALIPQLPSRSMKTPEFKTSSLSRCVLPPATSCRRHPWRSQRISSVSSAQPSTQWDDDDRAQQLFHQLCNLKQGR